MFSIKKNYIEFETAPHQSTSLTASPQGEAFLYSPLGKIAEFFFFYAKIIEKFFKMCYTVCAKQN